jgi:glycosyltransferase involved in cell wall biosynthesis
VTRGFPPRVGGVETLCRQLAEGFAGRGWRVTVLTYGGRSPGTEWVGRGGGRYHVIRLPSRGEEFEWSGQLVRAVQALPFDVAHVHNVHSSVAAAVWWSGRRPYVLTPHYHGTGHTLAARLLHPAYRLVARRALREAGAVTAVSATEADLVGRHFEVAAEVIPNGVDRGPVDGFPPGPLRSPGPPTMVVVSRLVGYKRVDAAVAALTHLPGFALRVIGDGPQRPELLRLADGLGVADRVRIETGRLSDADTRRAIRDAAVLVNLSEAEAFSYTVLESLAVETPVVANGASALAEWATRFPSGVHTADPNRPATIAAAVRRLADHRVIVDLGEYALPAILDRYEEVYARVAGAVRSRGALR